MKSFTAAIILFCSQLSFAMDSQPVAPLAMQVLKSRLVKRTAESENPINPKRISPLSLSFMVAPEEIDHDGDDNADDGDGDQEANLDIPTLPQISPIAQLALACNATGMIDLDQAQHAPPPMDKHTEKSKIHKCPYSECRKEYKKKRELEEYIQTKHKKLKFLCPQCPQNAKGYESRHGLRIHINAKHKGIKNLCPDEDCPMHIGGYVDRSSLAKHINAMHKGMKFLCPHEGCHMHTEGYKYAQKLREHIQVIHEGRKFLCTYPDCPQNAEGYESRHGLRAHINTIHEGIKFKCPLCSCEFSNQRNLNRHINGLHKGMLFQCLECDFKTNRKDYLPGHMARKHGISQTSPCNPDANSHPGDEFSIIDDDDGDGDNA